MTKLDWTRTGNRSDPRPESWQQVEPEKDCWQNVEAIKFVRKYEGSNQFIHALKPRARQRDWKPTVKQVQAIFAVKRDETPRSAPVFEKQSIQQEALTFIRSYRGYSRFLRNLRARAAANSRWVPSTKQAQIVLRIRGEESAKQGSRTFR
jgi:hypothetical protein